MVCKVRRHARLTTVACVLALGLLASACNSVPSGGGGANPLTCVPGLATPADYQKAFDQRGPVWSGGDGGVPVALPDGRILWMFGDTALGPVVNNRFLLPGPFVHNTFIVQTGSCFEAHVAGTAAHPVEWLPDPAPGQYYWSQSAVVDPSGQTLHVFLLRVATVPGATEWAFHVIDTRVATVSLPDLRVRSITTIPVPSGTGAALYGSWVTRSGGYAYVYGNRSIPTGWLPRVEQVVARAPATLDGAWQFWDGSGWSSSADDAAPMPFLRPDTSVEDGPMAALTVIPYGTGWLASAKRGEILSDDVSAWYSTSPTGPWTPVNLPDGRVATTVTSSAVDQFSYNGRVVVLPGTGPTVVYSVNTTNTRAKVVDAHLYGIRFTAALALPAPTALAARH